MARPVPRVTTLATLPENVVALIPAKDRSDSIAETVRAAAAIRGVTKVVVIDDGSRDDTASAALSAGAEVVRLGLNRGKAAAVTAGVEAAPEADIYLMVDADVRDTAGEVQPLLDLVASGEADMAIGVLPSAGGRGGFGMVRRLSAAGIRRATGFVAQSPLSGQRAIRGELLRSLVLAPRFGLETALTIDAVRSGARVVEIPVEMDHRHTGRRVAGFRHRAGQGIDIARALWPRLTSARQRVAVIVVAAAVFCSWMLWSSNQWQPDSVPLRDRPSKVVIFGMPHLGFDDLDSGDAPNLDRLRREGAVAAMSVRTMSGRPSSTEGYATLNASTRVLASLAGAEAFGVDDPYYEGGPAGEVAARRTGRAPTGEIVVVGYPTIVRQIAGRRLSSEPGALGDALHAAGLRTAVVGNADNPGSLLPVSPTFERPVAIALADRTGSVDTGDVSRDLLRADPGAPFGTRFDESRMLAATEEAVASADVIAIDGGDLDRAASYAALGLDRASTAARRLALQRTDALLGRVRRVLPADTLLLVVSVSPPTNGWRLTPVVVGGEGVTNGYVGSPSVKRKGVVTVTDVAPTVLGALGADVPDGMIGHAFRYQPDQPQLSYLRNLDRDAGFRESVYFPITVVYIVVQALLYLFAMMALSRVGPRSPLNTALKVAVVAIAAFPLATFGLRAVPEVARLGAGGVVVLVAIDAVITAVALRARRHALSPLSWVTWATVGVIVVDLATGGRLQYSSLLGYSLHTAARFFGIGNTGFAALAASAAIAASLHVEYSPRRREALVTAAALLSLVIVADGAPSLGDDVGGILTMVPVFALTLVALSGRRISWKTVALAVGGLALVLGAVVAIDLTRPDESRTHLARFVTDLVGGTGESGTTVARKAATNLHVLGASIWTWMVPIIAVFMLFILVYLNQGAALLPKGSARRVGVLSALAVGLLGFAVNDSGVVVTALVFVYLGPYLTLLAVHSARDTVTRLTPAER